MGGPPSNPSVVTGADGLRSELVLVEAWEIEEVVGALELGELPQEQPTSPTDKKATARRPIRVVEDFTAAGWHGVRGG